MLDGFRGGARALRAAPLLAALLAGCMMVPEAESGWVVQAADNARPGAVTQDGGMGGLFATGPALSTAARNSYFATAATPASAGGESTDGEAAPEADAAPPDEATATDDPRKKRLVIYTGNFELLTPDVRDARTRFVERVEELGGHLERQDDARVVCRVPAARFDALVKELPRFGAIVRESITALDVTRKYFDIDLRVRTAEKSRERLFALLEKADKTADVLEIEREIRRLTEEIELLKGQLRHLGDQVAYSTLDVHFSASAPQPRPKRGRTRSPFHWINQVGVEHVLEQF